MSLKIKKYNRRSIRLIKKFLHVGVPTTKSLPGEAFSEERGIYFLPPEASDFQMEYVRFLPDTKFPGAIHYAPHVAGEVDSIEETVKYADEVLMPKTDFGPFYFAFVKKDGAIFELVEMK